MHDHFAKNTNNNIVLMHLEVKAIYIQLTQCLTNTFKRSFCLIFGRLRDLMHLREDGQVSLWVPSDLFFPQGLCLCCALREKPPEHRVLGVVVIHWFSFFPHLPFSFWLICFTKEISIMCIYIYILNINTCIVYRNMYCFREFFWFNFFIVFYLYSSHFTILLIFGFSYLYYMP